MLIRWDELGRQRYEDMVSVLVSRLQPDAQRIDGKGGDGGRDVQIVRGQDDHITDAFELKSFTGRMTSGRRRQVEHSLKRAATLDPEQWSLLVPIDPTPAEDRWFRQIGRDYGFPIAWFGRTWLDEKMSAFPDIRRYFLEGASDEVVRLLLELKNEQANLSDVRDALGRIRALRAGLNEIDPYYRYEMSTGKKAADSRPPDVVFSASFGDVRIDVYPKYAGATQDRPVTINVEVVVGPDNKLVRDSLDYGSGVNIQPDLVKSVTINAPAGLGGSFTEAEIVLLPTNRGLDEPVTLALNLMDDDRLLASCPIHLTEQTRGLRGSVVTGTDSTGWLQTRLKMDVAAEELEVKFWLNPKPAMPAALVPLFRWLSACQPPHHLAIRWPAGSEIRGEIRTSHLIDESFGRVIETLAFLQNRSGIYWEMPASLTPEEGREIVEAATLLKGESIALTWKSVNLSLDRWGPGLEELVNGRPQQLMCEQDCWLNLEGATIPIGRIRTYFESARIADPEAVQTELKSGSVPRLRLVPGDNDRAQRIAIS